jgi:hypothetical protein
MLSVIRPFGMCTVTCVGAKYIGLCCVEKDTVMLSLRALFACPNHTYMCHTKEKQQSEGAFGMNLCVLIYVCMCRVQKETTQHSTRRKIAGALSLSMPKCVFKSMYACAVLGK